MALPKYAANNITTATTTVVKSGPGVLHSIIVNKAVVSQTVTVYDNTSAAGTKLATVTWAAALTSDPPFSAIYDIGFTTGLTVVTGGASDITITYA